jgi:hypothetical protein
VRFRDEKPGDLDRARAAVAAWRDRHPAGTDVDLIAAVGPAFHPDWSVVLRGVLFAEDRRRASTWVGYFGHGGVNEWGHSGNFFMPANVAETASGSVLPVVFAAGCETGEFVPGAPWHGPYVDSAGTTRSINPANGAQPGVPGPAIADSETGQTWGLDCPPPGVSVSASSPFVTPPPRAYDLPGRGDPSCAYLWTIASAPGGGIAYFGEMSVAPDYMGQELETAALAAYAKAAAPVLGDIYLAGQRAYWANHNSDPGVQSAARIYLSFMTFFGDPSLRLHPLT